MQTKYCLKCNKPTPQSDAIVRFCSHCGHEFASSVTSSLKSTIKKEQAESNIERDLEEEPELEIEPKMKFRPRHKLNKFNKFKSRASEAEDEQEEENGETDFHELELDPKNLGVEVEQINNKTTTLGNLALDKGNKTKINRTKNKGTKKINSKKFEDEWRNEMTKGNRSSVEDNSMSVD